MKVDLTYHELELLIQLLNQRFIELQSKDPNDKTLLEVALFKKLHDARTDEMKLKKGEWLKNDNALGSTNRG